MRILFVITRGDSIGGAQIHVRDLARRLTADGHAALVVTGAAGPFTDQLGEAGIEWTLCPGLLREIDPLRDGSAVAALRRTIRAFGPDLVSTHSSKAGVVGRLAARLGGVPCLFTAHGWAFTDGVPEPKRRVYRLIERMAAPLAARIICVSEHDRRLGVAAGIRPERLVTIHNGMPDIDPTLRADPGRDGPVKLVMTARFDRQKDHRSLLLALRTLPDVALDLIGDGPDEAATRALAGALGLGERVAFLGRRADVAALLADAHAFVLSSHWEGFPRSTLEAMRAGLPTVVSDAGGAAEAVVEGETGFVVPRADVGALADRLARLAGDSALRRRMGGAARSRYEAEFTFDRMYEETAAVYGGVAPRAKRVSVAPVRHTGGTPTTGDPATSGLSGFGREGSRNATLEESGRVDRRLAGTSGVRNTNGGGRDEERGRRGA